MIKAVIFDHDGTLVESEGRHFELWRSLLKKYDIDFQADEYIAEHSGIPTLQNAQVLVDKYHLPHSAEALYEEQKTFVDAALDEEAFEIIPGVMECMQSFAQAGLPMAIATGADQKEVHSSCKAHGFTKYIEHIATSEEVANSKPAPDVYLLAAEKLGVLPQHCIAIEDSNNGLRSALAAGIPCVLVRSAWSAAAAYEGASAIFEDINEAKDYILGRVKIS